MNQLTTVDLQNIFQLLQRVNVTGAEATTVAVLLKKIQDNAAPPAPVAPQEKKEDKKDKTNGKEKN